MKCDELIPRQYIHNDGEGFVIGYPKNEVDAAIAEFKAKLYEAEEARIEAGADAADYYQENRKLKRALWLARAWRAKERQRMLPNNKEFYSWQDIERKCLKKAEEYK